MQDFVHPQYVFDRGDIEVYHDEYNLVWLDMTQKIYGTLYGFARFEYSAVKLILSQVVNN